MNTLNPSTTVLVSGFRIRQRALDSARRELSAMTSELQHYSDEFSVPQLAAMRKVMRSLRVFIQTLED